MPWRQRLRRDTRNHFSTRIDVSTGNWKTVNSSRQYYQLLLGSRHRNLHVPNSTAPVMTAGMYVEIAGSNPAGYNFIGLLNTVTTTQITYPVASDPGTYLSGAGLAFLSGCCMNVYKTNDHWTTQIAPQNNTGPGAVGTPGQAARAWSTINPFGSAALLSPVNCDGKDYAYARCGSGRMGLLLALAMAT